MNLSQIYHRAYFLDCYPINKDELKISISTGKDIKNVNIYAQDPFIAGISSNEKKWSGEKTEMIVSKELKTKLIWSVVIKPKYKRLKYYFEICTENEKVYLLEDDFYTDINNIQQGKMIQRFIYPWLNGSDVFKVPKWVSDTIWYQIFPERFCIGDSRVKRLMNAKWESKDDNTWTEFYGGDLKGIRHKLTYLSDLGISGIYLNPIFMSDSNHKYDTINYNMVDTDFGSENDIINLVNEAHKLGIKVMIDAVFNHCGSKFEPWLDVIEKGEKSKYYSWFFVNEYPISSGSSASRKGEYYTFAFVDNMPKLNTNNIEVINYFIEVAKKWVNEWKVDGIRFDVGNEVSHTFIKRIREELKACNPDLFLLGEIWHDSLPWLLGDEYDSVMNYPLLEGINNFWIDKSKNAEDFKYMINKCFSMYYEQVNQVLFNILDSHDTNRLMERCNENVDMFFQQLVVLFTMEGSPCLYYGTEIGMMGKGTKGNRRCMPWEDIEKGKYNKLINEVKLLINIRNNYKQAKSKDIAWHIKPNSKLIHYTKRKAGLDDLEIYMNMGADTIEHIKNEEVIFSRGYCNDELKPGGVIIQIKK